jgi:hypothetical protein
MSNLDDLYSEMRLFGNVSEKDIERLLAGEAMEDATLDELAAALREARQRLTGSPDETVRRSHLLAMAAAKESPAAETSQTAASPLRSRQTFGRRVMRRSWVIGSRAAVAGGVLALSSLGLAYAGVDLPGSAAETAWETVGLDIPNQARADDVKAVIDSSEEQGCEFGQAVSEAASADGKSKGPSDDPCANRENGGSDEKAQGAEAKGSRATGEEHSADGRAKAAEKSGGRSEAGSDNAGSNDDLGRETASEKSDGKSDAGPDNAGSGGASRETASEKSDGKSDAGPDNAQGGKDTAAEKSGGSVPDVPGNR